MIPKLKPWLRCEGVSVGLVEGQLVDKVYQTMGEAFFFLKEKKMFDEKIEIIIRISFFFFSRPGFRRRSNMYSVTDPQKGTEKEEDS